MLLQSEGPKAEKMDGSGHRSKEDQAIKPEFESG
jgi:hypothetical protein